MAELHIVIPAETLGADNNEPPTPHAIVEPYSKEDVAEEVDAKQPVVAEVKHVQPLVVQGLKPPAEAVAKIQPDEKVDRGNLQAHAKTIFGIIQSLGTISAPKNGGCIQLSEEQQKLFARGPVTAVEAQRYLDIFAAIIYNVTFVLSQDAATIAAHDDYLATLTAMLQLLPQVCLFDVRLHRLGEVFYDFIKTARQNLEHMVDAIIQEYLKSHWLARTFGQEQVQDQASIYKFDLGAKLATLQTKFALLLEQGQQDFLTNRRVLCNQLGGLQAGRGRVYIDATTQSDRLKQAIVNWEGAKKNKRIDPIVKDKIQTAYGIAVSTYSNAVIAVIEITNQIPPFMVLTRADYLKYRSRWVPIFDQLSSGDSTAQTVGRSATGEDLLVFPLKKELAALIARLRDNFNVNPLSAEANDALHKILAFLNGHYMQPIYAQLSAGGSDEVVTENDSQQDVSVSSIVTPRASVVSPVLEQSPPLRSSAMITAAIVPYVPPQVQPPRSQVNSDWREMLGQIASILQCLQDACDSDNWLLAEDWPLLQEVLSDIQVTCSFMGDQINVERLTSIIDKVTLLIREIDARLERSELSRQLLINLRRNQQALRTLLYGAQNGQVDVFAELADSLADIQTLWSGLGYLKALVNWLVAPMVSHEIHALMRVLQANLIRLQAVPQMGSLQVIKHDDRVTELRNNLRANAARLLELTQECVFVPPGLTHLLINVARVTAPDGECLADIAEHLSQRAATVVQQSAVLKLSSREELTSAEYKSQNSHSASSEESQDSNARKFW